MGERLRDGEGLLNLALEALRACVGTDSLSPEQDSVPQELLATLASLTGALAPAVLLGIVLIKMFALRPFVWRRRASISHATFPAIHASTHRARTRSLDHAATPSARKAPATGVAGGLTPS